MDNVIEVKWLGRVVAKVEERHSGVDVYWRIVPTYPMIIGGDFSSLAAAEQDVIDQINHYPIQPSW